MKVLGDGNQKKPYVHVNELIQCMYFLTKKNKIKYNTYLCGPNSNGTKVRSIVNLLKKFFKFNKKIVYEKKKIGWKGDIPIYQYDVSRLNKEGFFFKNSSIGAIKIALKERYKVDY